MLWNCFLSLRRVLFCVHCRQFIKKACLAASRLFSRLVLILGDPCRADKLRVISLCADLCGIMDRKARDRAGQRTHGGTMAETISRPIRILFICHGNICRSPMAEFVMKDLAEKTGMADRFEIASAATSREEIGRDFRTGRDVGNPVYPPARRKLAEHGIDCGDKTARQMTRADYDNYDLLVCMDQWNVRNALRILGSDPDGKYRDTGSDPDGKLCNLLDFAGRPGEEVADPWYTGDFEATWQDVLAGCKGLLEHLAK